MATVLIVDDRPDDRHYLVSLLSHQGYHVQEAGDGAAALALARAGRPDLVISDILMPTMDGFELVRQLRAVSELAGTPVMFYTATYHEREALALALRCGVSRVIYKPCEPEELLRIVAEALGGAAPAPPPPPLPADFQQEHQRLLLDKLNEKNRDLEISNHKLTALIELGLQLAQERDPEQLLQGFCSAARKILGASYAGVGTYNGNGEAEQLRHFCSSGLDAAAQAGLALPAVGEYLRQVCREGRAIREHGLPGDPRRIGLPAGHPPVHSLLAAPVTSLVRPYGWIYLANKVGLEAFDAEDERLLRILGAQVGRIYENGSLYYEAQRRAAQLEQEINQRVKTQERLAWLASFPEMNPYPVLEVSCAGQVVYANPAAQRAFPDIAQAGLAHPLLSNFPAFLRLLRGGQHTLVNEVQLNSSVYHQTICLVPERQTIRIYHLDITELKEAEKRQRAFFDRALDGLMVVDAAGQVVDANPATCELLGRPLNEVLEQPIFNFAVLDQQVGRLWEEFLSHGRLAGELRMGRPDGATRDVEYQAIANFLPGRHLAILRDVTQRKALEDQFRQSQKMEAIGRLAGGVAHDFNNLLTIINGYSEIMLARLQPGDSFHGLVGQIKKSGDRATNLTRQLLAFSRKQMLAPVVLDINNLVSDAEKMLRRVIGEDIELVTCLQPELWRVKADPGQIEQVIMNLIVNARDAMPQGGRLTIDTKNALLDERYQASHPYVQAGPFVELAVSDTGVGMDAATRARAFEPFFTTKGERGTGLGLATVYGIVKQSGGNVEIYSEVGKGTAVKVYLPRSTEAARSSKSPHGVARSARGTETILLVEDEGGVRTLARMILQEAGYAVLEAASGSEALSACQDHAGPIHLLISDVVMPGMSGPQLAEALAKVRPGTPVLYLSGYTDEAVVQHGIIRADTPFLQKPFAVEELLRKVREMLQP